MSLSPSVIHERLQEAARRVRWARGAKCGIAGGALALVFLLGFLLLDAWVHFGAGGRWAGFALVMGPLIGGVVLAMRAYRRPISEEAVARRIEEAMDGSRNELISAVQFDKALAVDAGMRRAIFAEIQDPFPRVRWDRVFDAVVLKRLGYVFGGVAVVVLAWALIKPGYFANSLARVILPAAKIQPLTRTKIASLSPGNDVIVHGRDVTVRVSLAGDVPRSAWVHYREAGSNWQKAVMQRDAGQPDFEFERKDVRQAFEYYVEAGDGRSETFAIEVRPRTAIRSRIAEVVPPKYTGGSVQTVRDFTLLQNVTPGSAVKLNLEFNNAVGELKVDAEKGGTFAATKVGEMSWRVEGQVDGNTGLRLNFRDDFGLLETATLPIAVKPDEAPKVTVSEPVEGRELMAPKGASLEVKFEVTDDFGLGEVALYQSTHEKEDAKLIERWDSASGKRSFGGTATVRLEPIGEDDRVTLRVVAKDRNDFNGPGVTMSRPIVVSLKSKESLEKRVSESAAKLQQGLEALIKLQRENLTETSETLKRKETGALKQLVERQVMVTDQARAIVAAADLVSPGMRDELRGLVDAEMKDAVLALRNADAAKEAPRLKFLAEAMKLETVILAKLEGAPMMAESEAKRMEISELIAGLDDLLKKQRGLAKETKDSPEEKVAALAGPQDALAERATVVRTQMDKDSKNAAVGDEEFRKRLARVVVMFSELKVYEDMLTAAELLEQKRREPAHAAQVRVIGNLAKMVEVLNQWQLAQAEKEAAELQAAVESMEQKLEQLADIQRDIVEKTREMARKNEWRAEDVAQAEEIQASKDLMAEVVEQMVTDMHAFPDMKPGNEMKGELVQILEDVIQADKQEVEEGKLKPQEIAVQKEQGLLDAIEQAKELAADMEMWLPNKAEREKWLMENFDKNEMPEIPNVPLADAFEDIVGNLLDTQQDIQDEIQDAASNQAFAMNPANGWDIRDGPMPGFGAQGKSGNERPNHNEQMGRSAGGREGMSNGEMAGDTANDLEGDTPETRRTKDPLQQGQVKDEGGLGKTRATGGGKAGGFSDRQGMDGEAPVRPTKAPARQVADAAAVQQALLSEKTSKAAAQAELLYMRGDGLKEVARLMDENARALREGRFADAAGIHQRIVARLREVKAGVAAGEVIAFQTTDGAHAADKQLLGGSEGEAPEQYKEMVADYFRSLVEEK